MNKKRPANTAFTCRLDLVDLAIAAKYYHSISLDSKILMVSSRSQLVNNIVTDFASMIKEKFPVHGVAEAMEVLKALNLESIITRRASVTRVRQARLEEYKSSENLIQDRITKIADNIEFEELIKKKEKDNK